MMGPHHAYLRREVPHWRVAGSVTCENANWPPDHRELTLGGSDRQQVFGRGGIGGADPQGGHGAR
jgi:hypothetical protein